MLVSCILGPTSPNSEKIHMKSVCFLGITGEIFGVKKLKCKEVLKNLYRFSLPMLVPQYTILVKRKKNVYVYKSVVSFEFRKFWVKFLDHSTHCSESGIGHTIIMEHFQVTVKLKLNLQMNKLNSFLNLSFAFKN